MSTPDEWPGTECRCHLLFCPVHSQPQPVSTLDLDPDAIMAAPDLDLIRRLAKYALPGVVSVDRDTFRRFAAECDRLAAENAALREQVQRVRDVHARYFDLDGTPGVDDTDPEPEDVWRFDRDFRAVLGNQVSRDQP